MTVLQLTAASDGSGLNFICQPVKVMPHAPCAFYNWRKLRGVARSELPDVTVVDLLTGDTLPPVGRTQFDVLVWQSRIPPYASYIATCDTDTTHQQQVLQLNRTPLVNKRRRHHQEDAKSN